MEKKKGSRIGWHGILAAIATLLVSATAFAASPLNHNSANTGSTRWSAQGGWGVPGGKFGEFTCTTCHNKNTTNIKRVVTSIPNFIGYSAFPAVSKPVVFRNLTSQGFGDDGVVRTTSDKICNVCHTQTTVHKYNNPATSNHQNANRTDCTSCHSHDQAFGASCKSCHGYPPITNTIGGPDGLASPATGATGGLTGQHGIHETLNMACNTCHNDYLGGGHMTAKKLELGFSVSNTTYPGWGATPVTTGNANVYPNASLTNGYTWEVPSTSVGTTLTQSGANNTCNLYCHGSGWAGDAQTASAQSNGLKATANWNDTAAMTCNDCHGGSAGRVPRPALTGAHTRHAGNGATGLAIACASCHGATTGGAHVNGQVTVNVSGLTGGAGGAQYNGSAATYNSGNIVANQTYKNCSNIYCHSSIQGAGGTAAPTYYAAVWGGANTGCTMCHVADTTLATGSHAKHVTASGSKNGYGCSECHDSTSGNPLHANGTINVSMSYGTYGQTGAPQNGYSNCTVTCHGATATPNWGQTLAANCAGCHGNKASGLTAPHAAHMNFPATGGVFSCADCHANVVSNDTTVSTAGKTIHINAFINFSGAYAPKQQAAAGSITCSTTSCHNTGKNAAPRVPVTWTGAIDCSGCHGTAANVSGMPSPDAAGVNAHVKHVPTSDITKCVLCHDTTVTPAGNALITGSQHLNKVRDVRFSKVNSFANSSGAWNAAGRTCSTTYCHGNAVTTVAWGTVALACDACHQSNNALGGAHAIHYNSATTYGSAYGTAPGTASSSATAYIFACSACHGTVTSAHVDLPKTAVSDATIFFGFSSAGKGSAATTNYNSNIPGTGSTDARGFDWTNGGAGRCNTTYCHSNGRGGNGLSATVNWGTTARDAGCQTCHGNVASAGALSGAHNSHVNGAAAGGGYGCVDCHATTVSGNVTIAANSYNKHINKFVDYSGVNAGRNKICANIYCHSDGRGGYQATTTFAWNGGANLGCNSCHGNPPTTLNNSHGSHSAKGIGCAACHYNVTTSGTSVQFAGGLHINKQFNFQASGTYGVNNEPIAFNIVAGSPNSCNNVSCHNSGIANQQLQWGTNAGCVACHPLTNGTSVSATMHVKHIGTLLSGGTVTMYNYTANKTTSTEYRFGCANCHPLDVAKHINGQIDVTLNSLNPGAGGLPPVLRQKNTTVTTDAAGYTQTTGTTVTCAASYCHSTGLRTLAATTSPNWYSAPLAENCSICHGNTPTTNAHTAHQVGIHYDDIFNGKSGKLLAASTTKQNVGHGYGWSTTISCNVCHNDTVTTGFNAKNPTCAVANCHGTGGVYTTNNVAVSNKAVHVNGTINVKFFNAAIRSKAQIREGSFDSYTSVAQGGWARNAGRGYKNFSTSYDYSKQTLFARAAAVTDATTTTCSTVACHAGKSVLWNAPANSITCEKCHDRL